MRGLRWSALLVLVMLPMGRVVQAAEAGGAWYFEKLIIDDPTTPEKKKEDPGFWKGCTWEWKRVPGGVTTELTALGYPQPPAPPTQFLAWSWTAPPGKLVPGEKLRATLTLKVLTNKTRGMSYNAWQAITLDPHGSYGNYLRDKTGRQDNKVGLTTPEGTEVTLEGEATVPNGPSVGAGKTTDKLDFRVGCHNSVSLTFFYVYGWVPAGATPPPPVPVPGQAEQGPTPVPPGPTPVTPGPGPSPVTPGPTPVPPGPVPTPVTPGPVGVMPAPEPASVDHMTLQVGKRRVQAGETVMVPVWLIQGQDVANMNFTVAYETRVAASAGAVVKGSLLDAKVAYEANPAEAGTVYVGLVRRDGVSGTGPVAHIPFRVAGQPGDKTVLTAAVTAINGTGGQKLTIATLNGEIEVIGQGADVPGDSDGDGVLSAADALAALKMSVKLIPSKPAADVDKDGVVTSNDARLILERVVGK